MKRITIIDENVLGDLVRVYMCIDATIKITDLYRKMRIHKWNKKQLVTNMLGILGGIPLNHR